VDALDALFATATAKDPAQRFADARSMRRAIRALLEV
jgi:hypothetical protein